MDSVVEKKKSFKILAPIERSAQSTERDEIRKYLRQIPGESEPNLGRVREIKEEIKKGTYLTREIIEEAAMQLALRLLKKDSR